MRIIAATSVNLQQLVEDGRFRADLYYRLNVLSIAVPPLRSRIADIEALCESILEQIALRSGLPQRELTPGAIERLQHCAWRGNIRELGNVLEKAAMLSENTRLDVGDLDGIVPPAGASPHRAKVSQIGTVRNYTEAVAGFERDLLADALVAAGGRVDEAARLLGIARATLYRKLSALGIVTGRQMSHK